MTRIERIEEADRMVDANISAWRVCYNAGLLAVSEKSLDRAVKWASIATALRARQSEG